MAYYILNAFSTLLLPRHDSEEGKGMDCGRSLTPSQDRR